MTKTEMLILSSQQYTTINGTEMMIIRILKDIFLLTGLCMIVISAEAGSSATAITTITANIVPAASFSISNPIVLTQHTGNRHRLLGNTQRRHSTNSIPGHRVILSTADTANRPKFRINSTQNLSYDISMPSSVGTNDYEGNTMTNISHPSWKVGQPDANDERILTIGSALTDDKLQNTGTYYGIIDITVNYN